MALYTDFQSYESFEICKHLSGSPKTGKLKEKQNDINQPLSFGKSFCKIGSLK